MKRFNLILISGILAVLVGCEPDPCELTPPEFEVKLENATGPTLARVGDTVRLAAKPAPAESVFFKWAGDIKFLQSPDSPATWFVMPHRPVTFSALYRARARYPLTVLGGTGSGNYLAGERIPIAADSPAIGYVFERWLGDMAALENSRAANTAIIMPAQTVQIQAFYRALPLYQLTVTGGSGSGTFPAGLAVPISADVPMPGMRFYLWKGDAQTVADRRSATTQLVMPSNAISVFPLYASQSVQGISYSLEIKPIFDASCTYTGCHDGTGNVSNLRIHDEIVARADLIRSYVLSGFMPTTGSLPPFDVQAIVSWIDQGAPKN